MTAPTRTRALRYLTVVVRWCSVVAVIFTLCLVVGAYLWPGTPDPATAVYNTLALGCAAILAVMMATFVEVILLFVRAADGDHS